MFENMPPEMFNRLLLDIVLFIILVTGIYYDMTKRIIPNFLTGGGIIFGLIMVFILGTPEQVKGHLFGLVLGFGFFYILYLMNWVGGGDVKLMGVIGLLRGVGFLVSCIIYTAIFGGVIAIICLIHALYKKKKVKDIRVPYGTAICMGTFFPLAIEYGIVSVI